MVNPVTGRTAICSRWGASLLGVALLSQVAGCGVWSPVIRSDVLDYSDVIEQTSDKFLIRNILEARDNAPIHFVELPKINGSLQAQAGLTAALPTSSRSVNNGNGIATTTVTPSITVQSNPSFEVDSLATKEFVTGVSSQIDGRLVKYWYDRGLDPRAVLLLFFSSARVSAGCDKGTQCPLVTIRNNPREAADAIAGENNEERGRNQFELYLSLVNAIGSRFVVHAYREQALLAEKTQIPLKEISSFDPASYQLEFVSDKNYYNLYSALSDPKIVFCFDRRLVSHGAAAATTPKDACTRDVVTTITKEADTPALAATRESEAGRRAPLEVPRSAHCTESSDDTYCQAVHGVLSKLSRNEPIDVALTARSAAEVVRFLGDLVYYQGRVKADRGHNVPVTLGWLRDCPTVNAPECVRASGGWLFRLNGPKPARYSVTYRGKRYTAGQEEPDQNPDPDDHTLEVLAVVNQLINVNRSAKDITTTPLIRVIP